MADMHTHTPAQAAPRALHLAFVISIRSHGGVKTWMLEAALALRALGCKCTFFVRPGPYMDKVAAAGLTVLPFPQGMDFSPVAVHKFRRFFTQQHVDVVTVNVSKDLRTAGVAARLAGIPLVQRIGLPDDMRNTCKVRALHHLLKPRYLFPCYFNRNGFLQRLPYVTPQECMVIHTGKTPVDQARTRFPRPLRLLASSQLTPNKGHAELLDSLALLKSTGHAFHCHMLGAGPEAGALRAHSARLGLEDDISWHGLQSDVYAFLRQADVFVLPSREEGLPNTLLEGMSQGLIPVARDVGGVKEIWPPGLGALLFDASPGALTTALESVFNANEEQLTAWSALALGQCRTAFNQPAQAQLLHGWYASLTRA